MFARAKEFFRVVNEFRAILPIMLKKFPGEDDDGSLGALFEESVEKYPDNVFLIFEGQQWTYSEFNAEVNQLAHLLLERGIGRGDVVALFMENRAAYIRSILAVAKVGATSGLINNSLTGTGLVHCINTTNARACIVGEERASSLSQARSELNSGIQFLWAADQKKVPVPDWSEDIDTAMAAMATDNPDAVADIKAGETAFFIFTSGTTGLPKAAILPHRKLLIAANAFGRGGFRVVEKDRLYLCLPIYHITGMGPGLVSFLGAGASVFLRRRFSASNFWQEVHEYQTNSFIYVGELCRYLVNRDPSPLEEHNPIEKMLGNGLRPDVWDVFKERFGVDRICEIYGASEGNTSFINFLNKDKTIGASVTPVAVVQYDNENGEIVRDDNGFCIPVKIGEPGLLLGEINEKAIFDGYTDPEASRKKIIESVVKKDDKWFNTGDLVRQIDVGFAMGLKHFQFVDRTGDTFRWRAENVSTNEVAEVLNGHSQIEVANVYGVDIPGCEGRAGMASLQLKDGAIFDQEEFESIVSENLPIYARPVFVRIKGSVATTVTFKLVKKDLVEQAYHLNKVNGDKVLVMKPDSTTYDLLDETFYGKIQSGQSGY